ncbi:hypothetical protein ACQ86N_01425 [Puia sp. P3]|uniref:hypothetical protein n=1 Tax=Puia sp. P3 TaxID=3423952 RepID=UPI003D671ED0
MRGDGHYDSQQRFGLYRWHITDPIRFEKASRSPSRPSAGATADATSLCRTISPPPYSGTSPNRIRPSRRCRKRTSSRSTNAQ